MRNRIAVIKTNQVTRRCILSFSNQKEQGNIAHANLVGVTERLLFDRTSIYERAVIAVEVRNLELIAGFSDNTVAAGDRRVSQGDAIDRLSSDCLLIAFEGKRNTLFRSVNRD